MFCIYKYIAIRTYVFYLAVQINTQHYLLIGGSKVPIQLHSYYSCSNYTYKTLARLLVDNKEN